MAAADPVMHHYPAALIGTHSLETKKRARRRPIWVARRGVAEPFRVAAEAGGFDPADKHMYTLDEGKQWVDRAWNVTEDQITQVTRAVRSVATQGLPVSARTFAAGLVPLVAALLVRHPMFPFAQPEPLTEPVPMASSGATVPRLRHDPVRRIEAFWLLTENLLYNREWVVESPPDGDRFLTTDAGWQWLPGPGRGRVFAPLAGDIGLIAAEPLEPHQPTYTPTVDAFALRHSVWDTDSWTEVRRAMVHGAPRDVYSGRESDAHTAVAAWADRPRSTPGFGVGPSGAEHAALALLHDAADNVGIAAAGFMKAMHRWGCSCGEEAKLLTPDPLERLNLIRTMHAVQELSRF